MNWKMASRGKGVSNRAEFTPHKTVGLHGLVVWWGWATLEGMEMMALLMLCRVKSAQLLERGGGEWQTTNQLLIVVQSDQPGDPHRNTIHAQPFSQNIYLFWIPCFSADKAPRVVFRKSKNRKTITIDKVWMSRVITRVESAEHLPWALHQTWVHYFLPKPHPNYRGGAGVFVHSVPSVEAPGRTWK